MKLERLVRGGPWLVLACAGILSIVVSFFVLLEMCLNWLKHDAWPNWSPAALGYVPLETRLLGLNRIIEWVYQQQSFWILLIGGAICAWIGNHLLKEAMRHLDEKERAKASAANRPVVRVFFVSESDYSKLQAACPEDLPATYAEFVQRVDAGIAGLGDQFLVARVEVKVDEFLAWCSREKRPPDGAARSEYAETFAAGAALH